MHKSLCTSTMLVSLSIKDAPVGQTATQGAFVHALKYSHERTYFDWKFPIRFTT